jgi:hypothetical protein
VLERTSTTERYTRGIIAAVVAAAALILAANAGPARAAGEQQVDQVRHVEQVQPG